jgi:CheY-like chemotaxis protein
MQPIHFGSERQSYPDVSLLVGKRVVVCEDEAITQMMLQRLLMRTGLELAGIALDGQEAVDVVVQEKPDIVLMDVQMPRMNGLEAIRKIQETYPEFCLVMLTGNANEQTWESAQQMGATGFLVKPVTVDSLLPGLLNAFVAFTLNRRTPDGADGID